MNYSEKVQESVEFADLRNKIQSVLDYIGMETSELEDEREYAVKKNQPIYITKLLITTLSKIILFQVRYKRSEQILRTCTMIFKLMLSKKKTHYLMPTKAKITRSN